MTRMQPHIVITVLRHDRAHTFLAPGARLPRKYDAKHSVNPTKKHAVRTLPPPHPTAIRHIASALPASNVNQRFQRLTGATKNPIRPPRPQFPPRNDSP
jgi:hypothetical protein